MSKYTIGHEDKGARLFSVVPSGTGHVKTHEIQSEVRKHFFQCEDDQALKQVIKEVVESSVMEMFKSQLDMILGTCVGDLA